MQDTIQLNSFLKITYTLELKIHPFFTDFFESKSAEKENKRNGIKVYNETTGPAKNNNDRKLFISNNINPTIVKEIKIERIGIHPFRPFLCNFIMESISLMAIEVVLYFLLSG